MKYLQLNLKDIFRKSLLDAHVENPDYIPLPEERPGDFNWGNRPANDE